jgi:hypothetical protein
MKASKLFTYCDLCSQGVKLLHWRKGSVLGGQQLSLANRMHDFNTRDGATCCPKRFEAEHGMREAFDRSMVLLHEVVEIFGVANDDGRLVDLVIVVNRGRVAATLINRNLLWEPVSPNSLEQEGFGGGSIAVRCQEKIHGLPVFINRAIQIFPLAFDAHVRLIHPPALAHGALLAVELLFHLGRILDDPAIERGMIDSDSPLAHHLFYLPITDRVSHILSDAPQDDFFLKVTTLEVDHTTPPTSLPVEEHSKKSS